MHSDHDFTNFMNVFHSWRKQMLRMGVKDLEQMRIELDRESFREFETRYLSIADQRALHADPCAAPNEVKVAGIKIVMKPNASPRPTFVDPVRRDRIAQIRKIAEAYRRDAETVSRRRWWHPILGVHPDPRLKVVFLLAAADFDLRADEMERGR
jgi:hypothetical protein